MTENINQEDIDRLYEKLKSEAEAYGYHLNPDVEFTKDLIRGLIANEKRYGYRSCPCRLGANDIEKDRDIICPCDYRDPDLDDYGTCYCGLYVSRDVLEGRKKLTSIPERRFSEAGGKKVFAGQPGEEAVRPVKGISVLLDSIAAGIKMPVWRCKVCGYLCAREQPPEICPICKVSKERFERFL